MDIYFQQSAQPMVIYFTGGFNFNSYVVGGGGLVADGNYGDITVNGAGSNWFINTGVIESGNLAARTVTFDKLPQIAAYKFLGRHAGTNGDIQEIGIDGGLEFYGDKLRRSAITGDINIDAGDGTSILNTGVVESGNLAARNVTFDKIIEFPAFKILGRSTGTAGDAQFIGIDSTLEFNSGNLRRAALTGDISASAGSNVTSLATGIITVSHFGSGISQAGINLLTGVNAAAQRNSLGLGSAAIANTGDFAAFLHTHPLSGIDQSGATTGQVAQWNGSIWVPATFSGGIGGGLGSIDNVLVRVDGTSGNTAQGSSVTLDDSANLSTTNWSITTATYSGRNYARLASLALNSSLILTPFGNGYFSLNVPDGSFTGGNNRGNNAVDLTMERQLASQVASGAWSFTAGRRATASTDTAIAMGDQPSATGFAAVAIGYFPFATGAYSAVLGSSTASGAFCTAFGYYSLASLYGMVAEASGRYSTTGDAQRGRITARQATTNATPTNLFLDGSSARWLVPANSSGTAFVKVVARTATAGGEQMTWWRRVNWWRGVGTGTVDIDVETIGTDRGRTGGFWGAGPAWTLAITADTTNGGINVIFTGAAATNIRIFADVQWGENTFA